jgi:hypothetical protein
VSTTQVAGNLSLSLGGLRLYALNVRAAKITAFGR